MPKGIYERKPITKIRSDIGIIRGSNSSYPFEWHHSKHQEHLIAGEQKNKLPPLEILKWLFRYCPESGKLYRIRGSSGKLCQPEREIIYVNSHGYLVVNITDSNGLKKLFFVHQLIYFIVSGVEPLSIVDHINGDPLDNRFENLRLATDSVNQRNRVMNKNNTSGVTGVYFNKRANKWKAQVCDLTGKQKYLGLFDDKDEAIATVTAYYSNPLNNFSERHGLPLG